MTPERTKTAVLAPLPEVRRPRHAPSRAQWRRDLRAALELGQLRPSYQPIVSLADGSIRKAEALLRWQDPRRGTVSPADFIPAAEETGLIFAIDRLVLETVCDQLVRWDAAPDGGAAGIQVAINVSALQLCERSLPERLLGALDRHGLAPDRIACEITETALIDNLDCAALTVEALAAAGIPVSLDDFGTGYSNLVHLHRLPLDTIKVDQLFTAGVPANATDVAIVGGLVQMAVGMKVTTVAEGIETQAQLEALRAIGCDYGQGFLFAPALRPDRFADLLRKGGGGVDLDAIPAAA